MRDLLIRGCRLGHYLVSRDLGVVAAGGRGRGRGIKQRTGRIPVARYALYLSPDISPEPLNTPEKLVRAKLDARYTGAVRSHAVRDNI